MPAENIAMSDTAQQFREMMERFEYVPPPRPKPGIPHALGRLTDYAAGLVPLPPKPEPIREIPTISADCYAAMKRFA